MMRCISLTLDSRWSNKQVSTPSLLQQNTLYNMGMKNTHLEHLEDEILNRGSDGGMDVVKVLQDAGSFLSGKQSNLGITTKWDGAPAVVCGTDPQTGKFFVGTKSVFNKTNPKVCFSDADIDGWYKGALAEKLKTCLAYLPQLNISGIVQGDLLYTDDLQLGLTRKGKVVTFTPNTVTYSVPLSSPLAKQVLIAKMGIVFHTTYAGPSIQTAQVAYEAPEITSTRDVFVASANFTDASGISRFTPGEARKFMSQINRTIGSLKQASSFLDILGQTGESRFVMSVMFKQFFNKEVRKGKALVNTRGVAADFARFFAARMNEEMLSKKSSAAKAKYLQMKTDGLKFIAANENAIYFTVASYINIRAVKKLIINQLNKVRTIDTFMKTDRGFVHSDPEGYVVVNDRAYKLVDDKFRRANVTLVKSWDK